MGTRLERCYPNGPPSYEYPPQPPLPRLPPGKQIPPVPMKPLPPIPTISQPTSPPLTNNGGHPQRNIDIQPMMKHLDGSGAPLLSKSPVLCSSVSEMQSAASTWSLGTLHHQFLIESKSKASALLDSHDRFKPERSQRRPVQKMKWTQSRLARSLAGDLFSCSQPMTTMEPGHEHRHHLSINNSPRFSNNFLTDHLPMESESRVSSMTIADVSPRLAVKKVLLLYEQAQYREAAHFIQRLSVGTFRIILRELPLDILIDAMPHSVPILESLYSKVFASDGSTVDLNPLKPDSTVLHMVKFFSQEEMWRQSRSGNDLIGSFTSGCKEILRVIVIAEPKVMKSLQVRRRALHKAVEGMGQHGLVGTTDESLLPLHDALKLDFRRVLDAYKGALQKLEEFSLLSNKNHPKNVSHGPAPIQASHQRQLSLRAEEIQDRLIKNKSLLNVVEPTLDNHCLDILLGILQRRIECDKEALFQYTQLRKEAGDSTSESLVAPLLMRYSRGCKQVLELMREVAEEAGEILANYEEDSSDLSGYHSDSDSAIMTSGNSPFVSPRARYNFLSRSVRCKSLNRPSIISSSSYSSSGVSSADSRSGSSLPDATFGSPPPSLFTFPNSTNPTRPRHVKHRNQLYKNNSLASNSSAESESSQSSLRSEDESFPSILQTLDPESVDYVTVVTVPENQVISQGTSRRHPEVKESSADNRVTELKNEINQLRLTLLNANIKIHQFQEKEKGFAESRGFGNESPSKIKGEEDMHQRSHWVRQYGALYATARVNTMDALDAIPELASADELKSKLLFSVVVLSFRSVQSNVAEVVKRVQVALQMDSNGRRPNSGSNIPNYGSGGNPAAINENEAKDKVLGAIGEYLVNSAQNFHLSKSVEQVANQLWRTLYDYPCLKACEGLLKYIRACVTLAWGLTNLTPPCRLEYENRVFQNDTHVRYHSSDPSSDTIKTYLWPALFVQGPTGHCLHKGVVIT